MSSPLRLILIGLSIAIASCISTPSPVASSFWADPNAKVAIVLNTGPEHAYVYEEGSQGLLDLAIASAAEQSIRKHLKQLRPTAFAGVADTFQSRLTADGATVTRPPLVLDKHDNPDEWRRILNLTGADYLIHLRLKRFGFARAYMGFIPVGEPIAVCDVRGQMIDGTNLEVIWDTGSVTGAVREAVIGEWDQPPDYPNATETLARTLARSKKLLVDQFFEGRGEGVAVIGGAENARTANNQSPPKKFAPDPKFERRKEHMKQFETADTISDLFTTNDHPYKLVQDANLAMLANRKADIGGYVVRTSATADGSVIHLRGNKLSSKKETAAAREAFVELMILFEENGINVTRVRVTKNVNRNGFFLETDRDAYALLKANYPQL
ncbi:MAG: hypothetical protein AAF591_20595 [Verrucomicrobiota bacterium]